MKLIIKLLFKNKKLRLYVSVIIYIVTVLILHINSYNDYMNFFSTTFENKEIPRLGFSIVEFNESGGISKFVYFETKNFYENIDKYVKENGIEKLILKKKYMDLGERSYISLVEETKEYIMLEYFDDGLEDYYIYKYKVYFNGKIVPVYFYMDYMFAKSGIYTVPVVVGLVITLILKGIINFIFEIITEPKAKV